MNAWDLKNMRHITCMETIERYDNIPLNDAEYVQNYYDFLCQDNPVRPAAELR